MHKTLSLNGRVVSVQKQPKRPPPGRMVRLEYDITVVSLFTTLEGILYV